MGVHPLDFMEKKVMEPSIPGGSSKATSCALPSVSFGGQEERQEEGQEGQKEEEEKGQKEEKEEEAACL